jgi:23S rRNA (adenine2030-N6)-methyltransferase
LKHAALVAVLIHLRKKETPLAVIDAHAGRGIYDLSSEEAKKTDEARGGVIRLLQQTGLPEPLGLYCEIVRSFVEGHYPGSPLIAAKMLRSHDRLVAIEKQPDEYAGLAAALRGTKGSRAMHGDFRRELKSLLPPPERRGVVLIDPPYEADDEFIEAVRTVTDGWRRFATGIYLVWYPAKHRASVEAASGELLTAGIASLLRLELDIGGSRAPVAAGRGAPMTATGLLVVNPPFGFADQMKVMLPVLVTLLGRGADASASVTRLAGEA